MLVEVVDVPLGGGSVLPGESMVPATAETASAIVKIATAHIRCNLHTFSYLPERCKNFCIKLDEPQVFLQGLGDCVKLTAQLGDFFPCNHCKRAVLT
jgi:hypothetical protein